MPLVVLFCQHAPGRPVFSACPWASRFLSMPLGVPFSQHAPGVPFSQHAPGRPVFSACPWASRFLSMPPGVLFSQHAPGVPFSQHAPGVPFSQHAPGRPFSLRRRSVFSPCACRVLTVRVPVVSVSDGSEPLLTGRVPHLQFHLGVVHLHHFVLRKISQ